MHFHHGFNGFEPTTQTLRHTHTCMDIYTHWELDKNKVDRMTSSGCRGVYFCVHLSLLFKTGGKNNPLVVNNTGGWREWICVICVCVLVCMCLSVCVSSSFYWSGQPIKIFSAEL